MPYFFEWTRDTNKETADELGQALQKFFPLQNNHSPFEVLAHFPTKDQAKGAFQGNINLEGAIEITWSGTPDEPLKWRLPFPYHGVFLRRRASDSRALPCIWIPHLAESPGFRFIKKYTGKDKDRPWWRLGLMGGYFVEAPCRQLDEKDMEKFSHGRGGILSTSADYPPEILEITGQNVPFLPVGKNARKNWMKLHDFAMRLVPGNREEIKDEEDLCHRRLLTFPLWLKDRIISRLVHAIIGRKKNSSPPNPAEIWDKLRGENIGRTLIPPFKYLQKAGKVSFIEPVNAVDMASLLTRFQRMGAQKEILEKLPHIFRQNHPSFHGFVCPVQSPETERVGMTLHLSKKSSGKMDREGSFNTDGTSEAHLELGYGAGLIPFYQHNDGARNMMGAKNLRQALPLKNRKAPLVSTGGEKELLDFVKPLMDVGICPDSLDKEGNLSLGSDLLVAYLPWHGMNFEDAIVVGGQVADRGDLNAVVEKTFRREINPGWLPMPLPPSVISFGGMAKKGTDLYPGGLVAAFGREGSESEYRREIRYLEPFPAQLEAISFSRKADWMSGVLEYVVKTEFPLKTGDKLMGRHGNKGVVGAIIPANEMPKLPCIESIPKELRGRPIDVLLNPHGVISRMNLGQLIETHIGWLFYCGIKAQDLLLPGHDENSIIGQPFFNGIDHDKVQKKLLASGLDRHGRVKLTLPDGSETISPVTVGFQNIARLKHIPDLKIQARRGGEGALYNACSGQAVHGRTKGGGQRAGEMESWALYAHQAFSVLTEIVGVKSDVSLIARAKAEKILGLGPSQDLNNGFISRLWDWLFAVLIDTEWNENDGLRLSFLNPDGVLERIGKKSKITNDISFEKKIKAVFKCVQGGKKGCDFRMLDGEKVAVAYSNKQPNDPITLNLDELLTAIYHKRRGFLIKKEIEKEFSMNGSTIHLRFIAAFQAMVDECDNSRERVGDKEFKERRRWQTKREIKTEYEKLKTLSDELKDNRGNFKPLIDLFEKSAEFLELDELLGKAENGDYDLGKTLSDKKIEEHLNDFIKEEMNNGKKDGLFQNLSRILNKLFFKLSQNYHINKSDAYKSVFFLPSQPFSSGSYTFDIGIESEKNIFAEKDIPPAVRDISKQYSIIENILVDNIRFESIKCYSRNSDSPSIKNLNGIV